MIEVTAATAAKRTKGIAMMRPLEHRQGHGAEGAEGGDEEGQLPDPLVVVLGGEQDGVAVLDRLGRLGVLGLGAGDLGRGAQAPLGGLGDLGVVPQHLLVDAGQPADDLVVVAAGLQVGRGAAQEAAGRDRVEPGAGQQVDVAVGPPEGVAHVDAPVDVDDAVLGPLGAEDGQAACRRPRSARGGRPSAGDPSAPTNSLIRPSRSAARPR